MKRNVKILTIVLSVVLLLSTVAVVAVNAVAKTDSYLVITGAEMAGSNEIYGISTKSTANGVWSFSTTNNDPYVNLACLSNVGDTILRTYPYMVVRYKTSQFTSMEIFSGHPGVAHRRVSMPAPATNGQWGCLFYDFSGFTNEYKSWLRLEVATASGINMEIAEVVLFKNAADVTTYHTVYAKAGGSETPYVLTFNDFGFHGGNTGRNDSPGVSGITEVRPDNNQAMFNEGGYFTRLTAGGSDPYVVFNANNTGVHGALAKYTKVAIRYRAPSAVDGQTMRVYFDWSDALSSDARIVGDGNWQWAFFDRKATSVFRLDFINNAASGQYVDVAEVYFYNNTNDIYNAQVGANSYRNSTGGNTWFHSGMYMLHKSNDTYFQSVGTVAGGQYAGYQKSANGANFAVGNQAVTTVGRTFYKQVAVHSAHNSSTVTVLSTPTCTTAGQTRYSCSLCGETQSTTTQAAAGHKPGAAATCTTAQTCTVCSTQLQAALGHKYATVVTAPTCTTEGYTTHTCSVCSHSYVDSTVAATGHTEVIDKAVAATCTTSGLTEGKHCSVCNTVLVAQQTVAAKGHTPGATVVENKVDPTCTATGKYDNVVYCTVCKVELSRNTVVVDALGHKYTAVVTAPTCTTEGYTTHTCSVCSHSYVDSKVAATGHTEVIDKAVAATCTTTGLTEGKHCSVCGEVLVAQQTVDALGHTAGATVVENKVDPTCTATGKYDNVVYCTVCKVELSRNTVVVDALGHKYTSVVTAPTCTDKGYTTYTCSVCGDTYVANYVNALGHTAVVDKIVAPTYATTGLTEGSHCGTCGEILVAQNSIAKLNPLTLSYSVTLGEKFALNVKYVGFDGFDITVTDADGNAYDCTTEPTGTTHTDGNPVYVVKIAGISARNVSAFYTVTENASGYSISVSVDGYCEQMDAMYADKTVEDLAADYVAAGYNPDLATAMAEKQLLAYETTQAIDLYGQAAGNYFNQSSADHAALAGKLESYAPTNTDRTVNNTGDVQFKGASLVFGDEVELLFRMENYNREQIFVNGQLIPDDEINSHLSTDGTYVYFSWTVKPSEFGTVYTIRAGSLTPGDKIPTDSPDYKPEFPNDYYTGASTITYSVDAYIAAMQAKYATDTSAKGLATMNLVNALGNYGEAATAYAKY